MMSAWRVLLLTVLGGAASLPARAGSAQDSGFTVVSFNIRHGRGDDGAHVWSNRRTIVTELLRGFDAPIIGLQEVLDFQLREIANALPTHVALGVGRDDGVSAGEFSPLLIDTTRFVLLASGTFWLSDTPDVPGSMHWGNRITRITSWARLVNVRTRDTVRVYNLHWDHESQPSRERSAALLLRRIAAEGSASDGLIVTGDFNADESNAAFQVLVRDATVSLRDSYRARYPDSRSVGTFNGFRGDSTGGKIDAVLLGPGWTVDSAGIDRRSVNGLWPSDHFPVWARVRRGR